MDPIIAKNIERWKSEQDWKREKRERIHAQAVSALKARFDREPKEHEVRDQVKFILAERKAKVKLKFTREAGLATVAEIVKGHKS